MKLICIEVTKVLPEYTTPEPYSSPCCESNDGIYDDINYIFNRLLWNSMDETSESFFIWKAFVEGSICF